MRKPFSIASSISALLAAAALAFVTALPAGAATAAVLPTPVAVRAKPAAAQKREIPARVLSLSASATQMLYSIGAGRQVVGVDKYSTWPPNAPKTKFTGYETDAEDYLSLHPNLVIFAFASPKMLSQLRSLGIGTMVLPPATSIPGIYAQIEELGRVTGHLSGADATIASMRKALASDVARAKGAGTGRSYYVELDPTYYSATSKTFIGAEFSLFGMRDIADAAGHGDSYPQITKEYLLKADPDYVFLADTVCCRVNASNFAKRAGFSVLKAVRDHRVIDVNDSVASEWGPHTVEQFVSLLAGVLR